MTTPAATALIDIVQGASASKKKHAAGAGNFGIELAAATGKAAKASKLAAGHAKTTNNEATASTNSKTSTEVRNTGKTGAKDTAAVKAESAKVKGNGQDTDGSEQILAAMVQGEAQTKTAEGGIAVGAKVGDARAAGRIKADGQHTGGKQAADTGANASGATPDALADHVSAEGNKAVGAKTPASNGAKRSSNFEDVLASHREGASQAANHSNSHNAGAAAAHGHANGQNNTSARAEASVQTQAAPDASQGQAGALLRTTEASASSETFNPQLDAPTHAKAVEHVAWSIGRKLESGEKSFEIRMDPAELGRVDVKLQVSDDGKVSATLTVERPETLDLLTKDSRALEQALKDTGLDVGSGALNFSLRDQNASNARNQSENASDGSSSVEDTSKTQAAAPERVWFGMPKSAIDIKV